MPVTRGPVQRLAIIGVPRICSESRLTLTTDSTAQSNRRTAGCPIAAVRQYAAFGIPEARLRVTADDPGRVCSPPATTGSADFAPAEPADRSGRGAAVVLQARRKIQGTKRKYRVLSDGRCPRKEGIRERVLDQSVKPNRRPCSSPETDRSPASHAGDQIPAKSSQESSLDIREVPNRC